MTARCAASGCASAATPSSAFDTNASLVKPRARRDGSFPGVALSTLLDDAQPVRTAAEGALAAALTATGTPLDGALRCETPQQNVVATISAARWTEIATQLSQGNGGELHASGGHRPKFCSAFSSCALAVNNFGPFDATRVLHLPGIGVFSGAVEFEAQRSAGVRGYKPNLDLVAEPADGDWLFVESKCLEYLRPHRTAFSDAFVGKAGAVLAPETAAVYAHYAHGHAAEPGVYQLLDAAQLLKHFLAARVASGAVRKITLAYLFWEPADADDHPVFAAHRQEANQFAATLVDDHVRLVPLSYRDIWTHWEQLDDADLAAHASALRGRYDLALGPIAST